MIDDELEYGSTTESKLFVRQHTEYRNCILCIGSIYYYYIYYKYNCKLKNIYLYLYIYTYIYIYI